MILSDKLKDGVMAVKHEIKAVTGYLKIKKQCICKLVVIFEALNKVKES